MLIDLMLVDKQHDETNNQNQQDKTANSESDGPKDIASSLEAFLLSRETLEHTALLFQPLRGVHCFFQLALTLEQSVQVLEGDVLDFIRLGLDSAYLVHSLIVRVPIQLRFHKLLERANVWLIYVAFHFVLLLHHAQEFKAHALLCGALLRRAEEHDAICYPNIESMSFVLEALLPVIAIIDFLCDSTSNLECASITHNLGGAAVILDNQSQANCSVGHR